MAEVSSIVPGERILAAAHVLACWEPKAKPGYPTTVKEFAYFALTTNPAWKVWEIEAALKVLELTVELHARHHEKSEQGG